MKGLPLRLPRVSPRLVAAIAMGLALGLVLAVAGPLLSIGAEHPLQPVSTRVALVMLVLWGAGLWAARRSLLGPVLGVLCLLIAQGGPQFAWADQRPLRPPWARALLIGLIVLGYLAWLGWRAWRRDGREHDMRQLLGAMRRLLWPTPDEAKPERMQGALALRLQEAQRQWRHLHARGGWRGRLEAWRARKTLPWYLVLGVEGAGKSSLLAASSLRLLRCQDATSAAREGADCVCWLGERAIFVESAGASACTSSSEQPGVDSGATGAPPTGQALAQEGEDEAARPSVRALPVGDGAGSSSSEAQAQWAALLQALRGRGADLALHGVVLAVDVPLLLQGIPERLAQSALIARRQLLQVRAALGMQLPVHLVLTKADSLPGFEQYFGALDAHARRREQHGLWGFVMPDSAVGPVEAQPGTRLGEEFDLLHLRLEQLLPACLEQELSLQGRCRMYELPHAYAELATRLRGWIDTVFAPWPEASAAPPQGAPTRRSASRAAPSLRGVFLESCTSCGSEPPFPSEPGRFVSGILPTVLAADASSGTALAPGQARRRLRGGIAIAASLLLAAVAGQVLYGSYERTREQLAGLLRQTGELRARATAAMRLQPGTPGWEGVLRGSQDLLEQSRAVRAAWPLGAAALRPVRGEARAVALRLQTAMLAPRLASAMREQIEQSMQRGDSIGAFAALRGYLMLHEPAHYDASVVLAWARAHAPDDLVERALRQPAGVLQDPTPVDQALVQRAREWLLRHGRAQRLWSIVREQLPEKLEPPEYSLAAWQGTRGERPFRLASGQPLTRGVPGWFRPQAWQGVVEPRLAQWAAAAGAVDRMVLGDGAGVASDEVLREELRHAYWLEYARHWSAFLGDIRPRPMPGVEAELEYLQSMASENSDLLDLARQVWVELKPLRDAGIGASDPVAARLLQLQPLGAADADPGAVQRLRGWLDDYYTAASVAASAIRAGKPPGPEFEQAGARLEALAGKLPAPIGPVVQALGADAATALLGASGAVAQGQAARIYAGIADAFQEQVAQVCARTLANRFPLRRDGADADLEDFRAFFAPGGAADSYFRTYLQPWVDTSRRPWRYRANAPADAPAAPANGGSADSAQATASGPVARELLDLLRKRGPDPEAFARIAQVRNALWRNGSGPQWDFDISVPELDSQWAMLRLSVDGRDMRYAHGPVLPWPAAWPAKQPGSGHARLRLEGLDAGDALEFSAQGPWAWMHLLAKGRRMGASPAGGVDLVYGPAGRRAVLHVGGPEPNPWKPGLLEGLQCPR